MADDIRKKNIALRSISLLLALSLLLLPQAMNSRSLILLMDEYGTVPAPIAEEEEVKHACSINWTALFHGSSGRPLEGHGVPMIEDPCSDLEHGEVDVPPPKRLAAL